MPIIKIISTYKKPPGFKGEKNMKKTTSTLSVALLTMGSIVMGSTAAFAEGESELLITTTTLSVVNDEAEVTTVAGSDLPDGGCIVQTYYDAAEDDTAILKEVGFGTAGDISYAEFIDTVDWEAGFADLDGDAWTWSVYFDVTCETIGAATADLSVTLTIEGEEAETTDAPTAIAKPTISNINPTIATATWTAATGGDPVTKYEVYLGTTKVKDVLTTETLSHTFKDLTPDTSYTVKIKAINAGGSVESTETFKTTATAKSAKVELAAKVGETIAGTKSTITATGLKPGANYTIVLKSTPVTLASGTVADNGSLTSEVTIPAGLTEGQHTITLTSTNWDGTALQSILYFTLAADGKVTEITTTAQQLAATGLGLILPIGLALVLAGAGSAFIINGARKKASSRV